MKKKRLKLGLALGSGAARGLVHIGILKVLVKHNIYPDYIAGTSMGAVIGAAFASGSTPQDIAKFAKTLDWKEIVDFTVPKSGLVKGELIERKLRNFLKDKDFNELKPKLSIVAYNLDRHEQVVFSKGNVSKAVRASMSIPGILTPTKINGERYIDGMVTNPTPFDIVKKMGADVVIAVDLYNRKKEKKGPKVHKKSLMDELRTEFILAELLNVKNYLFPKRWPKLVRRFMRWLFDKFLYPAKVLRILSGRELPQITQVMYDSINILSNSYAKERMKNADVDIKIVPVIKNIDWSDFDKVDDFVKIGEHAMNKEIARLKKKLQ